MQVALAYTLVVLSGMLGACFATYRRVNIRALHNSTAVVMALIVGMGLAKHTRKLALNGRDMLAWGHFTIFSLLTMMVVWILVHHNRIRSLKRPAMAEEGKK